MNFYQRIAWLLCTLALLGGASVSLADRMEPGVVAASQTGQQRRAPAQLHLSGPLPVLRLEALTPARLAAETGASGPRQVGLRRLVPKSELQEFGLDNPAWQALGDGRQLLRLAVESPGALALRLGLRIQRLPGSAWLRFGGETEDDFQPAVTGSEVLEVIALNRNAAPRNPQSEVYWSPVVSGERLVLELELPLGSDPSMVELEIAEVSHIYAGSRSEQGLYLPRAVGDAGACNNDISCYDAATVAFGSATARMIYTDGGFTFVCTGTLLNDLNPSADFYFLTANHCISTQPVASTLQTYWEFRSAACNSATAYSGTSTLTGGATLISTLGNTHDTTLLRLNQVPPTGVSMSGWEASTPASEADLIGVHHPRGDWQKISFGDRGVLVACTDQGDFYACQNDSNGNFFAVAWYDGVTESGSSGSGIFTDDSNRRLVGNLSSGSSDCSNPSGLDFYASFADAYEDGNFGTWLLEEGGSPPVPPPATGTDIAKNLSTRGYVTPSVPMQGGIVVEGSTAKVLVTARGPSTGLASALNDTTMELFALSPGQLAVLLLENDDWGSNTNAAEIASLTANLPLAEFEAALLTNLNPGSYTSVVRDFGSDQSGEVVLGFTLVADDGLAGIAKNLSTRGNVTPSFAMQGGIVVEGNVQVLITARGPSTGLPSALADTTMELFKVATGQPAVSLQENDDWGTNANAAEIASLTASRPLSEREPALLVNLASGAYTAVVRDYNQDDSGEVVLGFTVIE